CSRAWWAPHWRRGCAPSAPPIRSAARPRWQHVPSCCTIVRVASRAAPPGSSRPSRRSSPRSRPATRCGREQETRMHPDAPSTLRALVDADALAQNVAAIRDRIGDRTLMAIVKGDAYGHGLVNVVPAVLAAGVRRFGVATLAEALDLHDLLARLPSGDEAVILFWLHDDTTDLAPALSRGFEVGLSTADGFARVRDAARRTGTSARVHLKVDTGLGRGGFSPDQLQELLAQLGSSAAGAEDAAGTSAADVRIIGLMSHLANADIPGDPATREQKAVFDS